MTVIHKCSDAVSDRARINESVVSIYKMALKGTLLAGNDILVNGWLLIGMDGKIAKVGCLGEQGDDIHPMDIVQVKDVIDFKAKIISPAFINAHDHIKYNSLYPLYKKGPKINPNLESELGNEKSDNSDIGQYQLRHDWRVKGSLMNPDQPGEISSGVLWNELRYIIGGTLIFADSEKRGNQFIDNSSDLASGYKSLYQTFPFSKEDNILNQNIWKEIENEMHF